MRLCRLGPISNMPHAPTPINGNANLGSRGGYGGLKKAQFDSAAKIGLCCFILLIVAQPCCCHGGAGAKGPPRQVSPMPSISEAVEQAAVANGGKNLIDRGPRCYERSPGELLPQTFPSEPSTAVEQQQANPLPDLPPRCPRHHALHVVTMAGSAGLHGNRDEGLVRVWVGCGQGAVAGARRIGIVVRPAERACALGGRVNTCVHTPHGSYHPMCSARSSEQSLG